MNPPSLPEAGALPSLSFVTREEERLSQTWSARDQADHEQGMRRCSEELLELRQRLEAWRTQTGILWERILTLTLERVRVGGLDRFLEETSLELHGLDQRLAEVECALDRLYLSLRQRRQLLAEKISAINPLASRGGLKEHINLMVERVGWLESHLVAWSTPTAEADSALSPEDVSKALLYLRVRLLTTRLDILAADLSRQLSMRDAELAALLPDLERLRIDLTALLARISSMQELARYWLAYLSIVAAPPDSDDTPSDGS